MKFKIGDKVRRIKGGDRYGNMEIGDVGTIVDFEDPREFGLVLSEFDGIGHARENFELVVESFKFKAGDKVKYIDGSYAGEVVMRVDYDAERGNKVYYESGSWDRSRDLELHEIQEEEKTTGLSLKEAVCAMIDGKRVTSTTRSTDFYMFFEKGAAFRVTYSDGHTETAVGLLYESGTYEIVSDKKETITVEGRTFILEDFQEAIKDLEVQ